MRRFFGEKINTIKTKHGTAGLAVVLVLVLLMLTAFATFIVAEDSPLPQQPATTISINSSADLITYSREYARGGHNPDDVLELALSSGSVYELPSGDDGYISIGNSTRPFNGKIKIANNATDDFILDDSFFGYVTTDVKIVNASNQNRSITIRRGTAGEAPIFAQTVQAGAGDATAVWSVTTIADDTDPSNPTAYNTGGMIGTIDTGSKVEFTYVNNALVAGGQISNVSASRDTGAFCGTLGTGATLKIHYSGTNTDFTVTSVGQNAGGVVGKMLSGSKVIIPENLTSFAGVTASSGYAGGIAGHVTDATVEISEGYTVTLSKTVSGGTGAGGYIGYFKNTSAVTMDVSPIYSDTNLIVTGSGYSGGLIGHAESQSNLTIDGKTTHTAANKNTFDRKVKLNGGTTRGGVIGAYSNTSLANTLLIKDIKVNPTVNVAGSDANIFGGVIGQFIGDNAVYAKVSDVVVKNGGSSALSAGILGKSLTDGTKGCFLDVDGLVSLTGNYLTGVARDFNNGVIRLKGFLDEGGAYSGTAATFTEAQILGKRNDTLVYALGSGFDTLTGYSSAGWTFRRGSSKVDDVYTWGEVLRLHELSDGTTLSESDFFTVDMSAHTVTLAGHVANMATIKDFIKTALNCQLNSRTNGGALLVAAASHRDTVLATNMSITADIDLTDTGIEAMTRDNGATIFPFCATFEGNNHKITLAIGEAYGLNSSGTALTTANTGNNNYGTIIRHGMLGLFGRARNATIQNLTIDGFSSSVSGVKEVNYYIGGIAAVSTGTLTLTNVHTEQENHHYVSNGTTIGGGAVGLIDTAATGTITISDSSFNTQISETKTAGSSDHGGAIGQIATKNALTVNVNNVSLGGTYTNGSTNKNDIRYGGLIGSIAKATTGNAGSNARKVNLTNITIADTFSATSNLSEGDRSNGAGTMLGSTWYDADVTIGTAGSTNGITVGSTAAGAGPSLSVLSGSTCGNMAGLVYKATGYWDVNHVKVNKLSVSTGKSGSTFGFLVNDGITDGTALYLELDSDHYDIANTSFSGNYTGAFDEVVAFTRADGTNLADNGQAIVSISTPSGAPLIMSGSACNTYQNQTTYGKNTVKVNPNTRYYYNLDSIRTKASPTAPEKLLLWSLNRYAHSTVKNNFTNHLGSRITGTLDMTGLSYYPVDASGMTVSDATIKFYNEQIETGEVGTGNSDNSVRSTRISVNESQHRLMHEGLFRNYTGNMTVSNLTVQGNVSNGNGGSGFLVCGNIGDTDVTSRINIDGVTLSGAEVDFSSGTAPLLINSIGDNVNFAINDVSTWSYSGVTLPVATSLIGDVGRDTASNVSLTFSDMVLDARTTALSDGTADGYLTSAYGTSRSIFERATLLNSFSYLNGGMGQYNYTFEEDWTAPLHQVTYGQEVTESVEYAGREDHYYDDTTHYTNPISSSTTGFSFATGFLPYVYDTTNNATSHKHELRVNIKEIALINGCGQYNDPYMITDGGMIVTVAKIISGAPDNGIEIMLPDDLGVDMWCADSATGDRIYSYNGTNFAATDTSGNTQTLAATREYLAGAYYNICNDIVLPADYVGLGYLTDASSSSFENPNTFRGIIYGNNHLITNRSANPLVKTATGCVIKNITIAVEAGITISQTTDVQFRYDSAGCASYGAAIGQVMGGDNIIEKVSLDFSDTTFSYDSTTYRRRMAVGGYVGVIVNGGVIFRNMSAASGIAGITNAKCTLVNDAGWLYVNPIIGRVLAGYAFAEGSTYEPTEAGTVMKNGTKGCGIPTLNPGDSNRLTVNATSATDHPVTVPTAQSLYILSCIINTGAGSATYSASTATDYATISGTPWIAYRNYSATRCAAYSEVGTSATIGGDYAVVAARDQYTGLAKIPYIIRQYTSAYNGVYHARSISGTSTNVAVNQINLASSATYTMPVGFRGIGSFYYDNDALKLRFKRLYGNGSEINLRMSYQEYNPVSAGSGDYPAYENAGFGLFNVMFQMYTNVATNLIKDLTLSGKVFYDLRAIETGGEIKYAYGWHNYNNLTGYYPNEYDRIESTSILHTGGLAGTIGNAAQLSNITMDSLEVEGAKYAGGLIGYASAKTVTINNPSATDLSVTGGFAAGGVIGGFYKTADLTIAGTESKVANFEIDTICVKGQPSCAKTENSDFNEMFHTGGGLCGMVETGTSKTLTVSYVNFDGGNFVATWKDKRPEDMRYKVCMAGLFGRIKDTRATVSHCEIDSVTMDGNLCGGIAGYINANLNGTFTDISVTDCVIDSRNSVGAFAGYVFQNGTAAGNIVISEMVVDGCTLASSGTNAERASAGGLVGYLYLNKADSSNRFNVFDTEISNTSVSRASNNTTDKNAATAGLGGYIGTLYNGKTIYGHNVLLNNVTVTSTGNSTPGMLIGTKNAGILKMAGVSVYGGSRTTIDMISRNKTNGEYGTNGYVIFADYNGSATLSGANTSNSTYYNTSTNPVDLAAASPYVTVNPAGDIGSSLVTLTGEGIAETVADLPATAILAANGGRPYTYSATDRTTFASYASKLSTYNTEQTNPVTDDFAVLVIDDTSHANTTAMINSYINMLTNTTGVNYASNNNNVYTVVMSRMTYNSGTGQFDRTNNNCNLQRSGGEFYMLTNSVDTAGDMFSLIDVQFKDPTDTNKIAYHLYVPVLVKKMLKFDFVIATGSGTNYERDWYGDNDRYGAPLMENLGTPASIYFTYNYLRTQEEWQKALDNGESMLRNYTKTLSMTKPSSIGNLPDDTILVLVDPNNGNKPYYARFSDAYSGTTLSLSAFRETLDDNTSAAFTPVDFNEMLNITAVTDNDGNFVTCAEGAATVKAGNTFYRLATDDDSALQHYTLTVTNTNDVETGYVPMDESYYVSFFTESGNSAVVYHYTITCPADFGDPVYPSKIDNLSRKNTVGTAHLILGNIFVQSGFSIEADPPDENITASNDTISISYEATVSIDSGLKVEVEAYLGENSSIQVFQSFLTQLTRTDDSGSAKIISGNPRTGGSYTITSANGLVTAVSDDYDTFNVNSNYVEFVNSQVLNSFLKEGNGAVITADVTLQYMGNDSIRAQFPNKTDLSDRTIGVTVSGSSNVAFDPAKTAFSKCVDTGTDANNRVYYCRLDQKSAKLYYNVSVDEFEGDYGTLGINPLDSNGLTRLNVSTVGVHDIGEIMTEAVGYDLIRCKLQLSSKNDNYATLLNLSDYLSDVWLSGDDVDTTDDDYIESKPVSSTEYSFIFPREWAEKMTDSRELTIPIDFTVYTGSEFEAMTSHFYSNYKVTLTVELLKSDGNGSYIALPSSRDTNFIIYTNARIIPDFIVE